MSRSLVNLSFIFEVSCRNISRKNLKTCSWQNQMHLLQPKLQDRKKYKKLEAWSNTSSDVLINVSNMHYHIEILIWFGTLLSTLNFNFEVTKVGFIIFASRCLLFKYLSVNLSLMLLICPFWCLQCLFLITQCVYNWYILPPVIYILETA